MPFLQEGGSVEAGFISGPVGFGLPAAELVVDPDKIIEIKQGFEDELTRVRLWLWRNKQRLLSVDPWAGDPCTGESADAFVQNGLSAIAAAGGYVDQLSKVVAALGEIASSYRLTDDDNARQLAGGHP